MCAEWTKGAKKDTDCRGKEKREERTEKREPYLFPFSPICNLLPLIPFLPLLCHALFEQPLCSLPTADVAAPHTAQQLHFPLTLCVSFPLWQRAHAPSRPSRKSRSLFFSASDALTGQSHGKVSEGKGKEGKERRKKKETLSFPLPETKSRRSLCSALVSPPPVPFVLASYYPLLLVCL